MVGWFIDKNNNKHYDDPSINQEEGFLRRILPLYWKESENRLSTTAFGPENISFCLESGISAEEFHGFFPDQGIFRIHAFNLRKLGEILERNPVGDLKWEKAHALSWGKRNNKIKKRKMVDLAEVLIPLPGKKF